MIDFRRVQTQSNRQNLELAFSTAEREFGVTRLLDPEGNSCVSIWLSLDHKDINLAIRGPTLSI